MYITRVNILLEYTEAQKPPHHAHRGGEPTYRRATYTHTRTHTHYCRALVGHRAPESEDVTANIKQGNKREFTVKYYTYYYVALALFPENSCGGSVED